MRYSLESGPKGTRLTASFEQATLESIWDSDPEFGFHFNAAKDAKTLKFERNKEVKLTFDIGRAFLRRSEEARQSTWSHTYLAFAAIANYSDYHDIESPLEIAMTTKPPYDGMRLGMNVVMLRPKGRDKDISLFASRHMRSMARQIHYPDSQGSIVDELVYANYSKEYGVTLETNPFGSCSLDTDGNEYHPFSKRIELFSHNIYSPKQQVICATGAIAVAHFNTLSP